VPPATELTSRWGFDLLGGIELDAREELGVVDVMLVCEELELSGAVAGESRLMFEDG
jgi:hypothetical protein